MNRARYTNTPRPIPHLVEKFEESALPSTLYGDVLRDLRGIRLTGRLSGIRE
jgi:hypothetical protein